MCSVHSYWFTCIQCIHVHLCSYAAYLPYQLGYLAALLVNLWERVGLSYAVVYLSTNYSTCNPKLYT